MSDVDNLPAIAPPSEIAAPPKTGGASLALGARGIEIRSVDDALRFCRLVVESRIGPEGLDTPQKAFVALRAELAALRAEIDAMRGASKPGP